MTTATQPDRADAFPLHVLREYALLADSERGILVGPSGDFVWMCAPRWDSDAVFSTLIGGQASTPSPPPIPASCGAATTRTAPSSGTAGG